MLSIASYHNFSAVRNRVALPTLSRLISRSRPAFDENDESAKSHSLVAQFGGNVPRPSSVIILPLQKRPLFPGFMSPLIVKSDEIAAALEKADNGPYIGLFYRKDKGIGVENPELITSLDEIHKVGIFA